MNDVRMSCRIKFNKKENFNIDQKMKDFEKKKENPKKEEKLYNVFFTKNSNRFNF